MQKNLQPFWGVQKVSGAEYYIFTSEQKVQETIDTWNKELDDKLKRWEAGDYSVSDSLIQSRLEPDLEGGCTEEYVINPVYRPSGYIKHEAYTQLAEVWKDAIGYDLIQWGNPATARFKAKLSKIVQIH